MKKRKLSKLKCKKYPRNAYFIDEMHVSLTFLKISFAQFINEI